MWLSCWTCAFLQQASGSGHERARMMQGHCKASRSRRGTGSGRLRVTRASLRAFGLVSKASESFSTVPGFSKTLSWLPRSEEVLVPQSAGPLWQLLP